jgi:hypothetical protein
MDINDRWNGRGLRARFAAIGFVVLFLGLPSPLLWAGTAKELNRINRSCGDTDSSLKSNALSPRFFAALSFTQPVSWTEFPSEAALQAACPKGCFRKAAAYFKGPALVLASLEFKSPSDEWLQNLKYYFREDGTLEKIHSDFRRFGAYEEAKGEDQQFLVKVIRDRYYDPRGKCIKKSSPRCFNTSNGREVRDTVFKDEPWPLYPSADKLPFYGLIQPVPSPTPSKN